MKLASIVRLAADTVNDSSNKKLQSLGESLYGKTDASKQDAVVIIGGIIKAAISVLGIVFVLLTVYAGYLWMTARGDEGKVEKAKDTLQRAVIGLIIVISAYAITSFVLTRVTGLANSGTTTQ